MAEHSRPPRPPRDYLTWRTLPDFFRATFADLFTHIRSTFAMGLLLGVAGSEAVFWLCGAITRWLT